MAYLLDANVFIEAKRLYYAPDICPAFWDWIAEQHAAGTVYSVDAIRDELMAGGDALADWVKQHDGAFWLPPDAATLASMQAVSAWVRGQRYRRGAQNIFLQGADGLLVAHAHAHRHTVVTLEVVEDGVKQVKIPEACAGVGVRHVNTFKLLRTERARFVLPAGAAGVGTP